MSIIWIDDEHIDMSDAVCSVDRTELEGETWVPVVDVTFEEAGGETHVRTFRGQEACDAVYRYWLSRTHTSEAPTAVF